MMLFVLVALCSGAMALAFLFARPHWAVLVLTVSLLGLVPVFQRSAGLPAAADGRLAAGAWQLLAVAPLADSQFLVSVRFQDGTLKTYALTLNNAEQRDRFLKAAGGLKKGKMLIGRAKRGRAGLLSDSDMDFDFADAPEAEPKEPAP